jgi:hypothetical protein
MCDQFLLWKGEPAVKKVRLTKLVGWGVTAQSSSFQPPILRRASSIGPLFIFTYGNLSSNLRYSIKLWEANRSPRRQAINPLDEEDVR